MRITAFDDAREYQRLAEPLLANREAEFNFLIGLLASLAEQGWQGRYDAPPLLALLEDHDQVVGLAMRTPPHNLLLTDLPPAAIPSLVHWLNERRIELPGVLAPKASGDAFAAEWSPQTRRAVRLAHAMRNHQLRKVTPPPLPPGQMRPARPEDLEILVSFAAGFARATGQPPQDHAPLVRRQLQNGGAWVWENQEPVAMANSGQPTPHGIRINWVYTPPEHRRHGYATALVAQLSQHLLDSGRKFCFLFTDLANPTANSIYRKIGYEGVCDYAEYRFE